MRTPRRNGFTLIELLVTLAILGLLAGMILAGVGMAGLTAARTRAGDAAVDAVATPQHILRERLSRLRSVTRLTTAEPIVDAEGDPASFAFVGSPVDRVAPDALYRFRLAMTAGGDVVLYAASVLDERASAADTAGWSAVPLVRGAAALSLAYFGDDPANGGRRWQSYWSGRPQPPDLIRVRVAFPVGDRRVWPDLVVRPRATVNSACRIDRFSGRCETRS